MKQFSFSLSRSGHTAPRAKRRVGIDVGATAVRAVEIEGIDPLTGFARVTKIAVVPLSPNAVEVGKVRQPLAVAQAISRALKLGHMSPYGVVLGIANTDTALRRVDMPVAVRPDERVNVIRQSRVELSPTVETAKSAVSVAAVGPGYSPDGAPVMETVAVAATRQYVDALHEACRVARVYPRALDHSAAALMRALVRESPDNRDVHTVVDIGESKTIVATREGLDLRYTRTLTVAGSSITRQLVTAAGTNWKDAELLKKTLRLRGTTTPQPVVVQPGYGDVTVNYSPEEPPENRVEEIFAAAVDTLVDQIAQEIENDAQNRTLTQGITVVGGGGQLVGLRERLQNRTGVLVISGEQTQPWATIIPTRYTEQHLNARGVPEPAFLISLTTAIGLAMWTAPTL